MTISGIKPQPTQLPFILENSELIDQLNDLDISTMTPIEAITKLYELQRYHIGDPYRE